MMHPLIIVAKAARKFRYSAPSRSSAFSALRGLEEWALYSQMGGISW